MKKYSFILIYLLFASNLFFAQTQKKEVYELNWLKDKSWHLIQDNEMPAFTVQLYTPPNETIDNWSVLGNTTHYKNVEDMPLDTLMYKMFYQTRNLFSQAQLHFIAKNENTKKNWILFYMDVPEVSAEKAADSQILHLTIGKNGIYSSIITVKKRHFTDSEIKKFSAFLRKSKLVYK
ncbi:MAG: hypothetical protein IPM51_13425 [Sphingobacteriaceae bacterium]|nr:hypothetical protein [Sphingobacteriaceae bacterium]